MELKQPFSGIGASPNHLDMWRYIRPKSEKNGQLQWKTLIFDRSDHNARPLSNKSEKIAIQGRIGLLQAKLKTTCPYLQYGQVAVNYVFLRKTIIEF